MRRMMTLLTIALLALGGAMFLFHQVEAGDSVPTIYVTHSPAQPWGYNQFSKLRVTPVFDDDDPGDTLTVSVNMDYEIDHNSTIRKQLPFFNFTKGYNWDFDNTTGEFWMQLDDQNIWWDGYKMHKSVPLVIAFEVEDQDGNKANASIFYLLDDVNEEPEKPDWIYHTSDPNYVGENVTFWVDEVSDPENDTLKYLWDFGDGATDIGRVVNHSFSKRGWKTVQMWVEDDEFQTEKISLRIEILESEVNWNELDDDEDGAENGDDAFPSDPAASVDSDEDGYPDAWNFNKTSEDSTTGLELDEFPNDPTEWKDTDEDGYGDNSDEFPEDPAEWRDTDGDGVGDNTDHFPLDPTKTVDPNKTEGYEDSDGDGVVDVIDAFPTDPAASIDTDYDGYPDSWNPGMSEANSTTGLKLDRYPNDRDRALPPDDGFPYATVGVISGIIILIILVVLSMAFVVTKRRRERSGSEFELQKYLIRGMEETPEIEDTISNLRKLKKAGKISHETYDRTLALIEEKQEDSLIMKGKL